MRRYNASEIRFNLMAVIRDRLDVHQQRIDDLTAKIAADCVPDESERDEMLKQLEGAKRELKDEQEKRERYKVRSV
jgi:hypothetical protein